ncbi:MAG: HemK family protein methyltransferase [Ginsengibacter sp.]
MNLIKKMQQKRIYEKFLEILKKDLFILPDKKEENAHNTISALWHYAAGNPVSAIRAEKLELPRLLSSQISILKELVQNRLSGTPLAHLTERQNFMGLDYIVPKGHYIPRNETELLAKTAIDTISNNYVTKEKVFIIDLCTGIGTVALAIAHYSKNTYVFGSDIHKPAIDAAKINAKYFSLDHRVTFLNSNMFDSFESFSLKNKINIIVSAPPYISSKKVKDMHREIANHEPTEAFDAGPFGLSIFLILISIAPEYLIINGYLIMECGLGQGEFLADRIKANEHYGSIEKIYDDNGNIRVLKAKKIV